MLSRKTWVNGLALIAVGVWIYVALKMREDLDRLSELPVCGPDEGMVGCARWWSAAGILVLLAVAVLVFMIRQSRIASRQICIADRLKEISEIQHKQALLNEMTERRFEIDIVADSIGREFMKLQFTPDLAVARNVVVTLQHLIECPAFVKFTSADLRFELRRLLEHIKKRHAGGSIDLKRLPIESLLDRLFERSLEAQDGVETIYEGLMGEPIARPARGRLEKWRADKAAASIKPRLKNGSGLPAAAEARRPAAPEGAEAQSASA